MMKTALLLVGLGGAIGSMLRYLSTYTIINRFPQIPVIYSTLVVNIIGSFLIGLIFGLSMRYDCISHQWRLFLATGICGGYTTFSAFSHENINLLQSGHYGTCFLYILISVIVCLIATWTGLFITR